MGQVDIPISMRGGFKNLQAAKAHREITSKLQSLRANAQEAANDLKQIDVADIDSTPSEQFKDLAPGKGHVITIWDAVEGKAAKAADSPQGRLAGRYADEHADGDSVSGLELKYNTGTGAVTQFTADIPEGKLTQWADLPNDNFSSTFRWEENQENGSVETTYFKFDDRRGVVSILDQKNDTPAILGDADVNELTKGTLQGGINIIAQASTEEQTLINSFTFQE